MNLSNQSAIHASRDAHSFLIPKLHFFPRSQVAFGNVLTPSFSWPRPGLLFTDGAVAEVDFEKLVEEYYMPLYRFGLSLSRNESDAFDFTQQTFYAWAAKGHQLRDTSKVKTWLFTTLYREFLAKKRRDERFVETDEDTVFAEPLEISPSVIDEIDAAIVQKALHELDERYRAPVTLFYMDQHSYREIAEILSLPLGTVMSRISRGKAALRRRLSDLAAEEARKILPMKGGK
jgi:RNA polymerase sigma-70 factor (ECF subfamily)